MENLSGGFCFDGGKTKSTPNLGFRLRLEFDKNSFIFFNVPHVISLYTIWCVTLMKLSKICVCVAVSATELDTT